MKHLIIGIIVFLLYIFLIGVNIDMHPFPMLPIM